MGHAHDHDHHGHAHGGEGTQRRLLFVAVAGGLIALAEVAGGLAANSLVLLADAAHYAADVAAVLLAFAAVRFASRPANASKTFGYKRAEVLAAFVNAAALWGLSAYFAYEAYRRIVAPPEVAGPLVLAVGAATLVANGALAFVLSRGQRNLNVRAAYLHVLSDVLGSAAALVAGGLVTWFGWQLADPVLTIFVTILILVFTFRLTRDTLHILLEGTPRHIDVDEVQEAIRAVAPVQDVHELHLWSLTSGSDVLTVHVVLDAPPQGDAIAHEIHRTLREKFHIDHVTVQVESPACPCDMARCAPA